MVKSIKYDLIGPLEKLKKKFTKDEVLGLASEEAIRFAHFLATERYEYNSFGIVQWEKPREPYRTTAEMYQIFLNQKQ